LNAPIDLSAAEVTSAPFPHFYAEGVLDLEIAEAALRWFEAAAPWKLTVADFYEQHEFSLLHATPPPEVASLCDCRSIDHLREEVGKLFGAELGEPVHVTVHKLTVGQRIRIHNDYIPGRETHRVLIQLNRGWSDELGGMLMLFGGPRPEDVRKIVPPVHRAALGFAISTDSHHAVSTVYSGERYTIVYSFYGC
jgi:Rps23 Pro-64 3,4-dihydroxylase Tpa1-like proline 4-hydroxylase